MLSNTCDRSGSCVIGLNTQIGMCNIRVFWNGNIDKPESTNEIWRSGGVISCGYIIYIIINLMPELALWVAMQFIT